MEGFDVTYLGAFAAGIVSFLSPCVLPLVPPYLCFLGGVTFEELSQSGETQEGGSPARGIGKQVALSSVTFVLGFATVFIALGATASWAGAFVGEHLETLSMIAGVVIIALGLHFIGIFRISVLFREFRLHVAEKPAGLLGAYVIGLAFAFGWTPCVGPVLATILFIAGNESSVMNGAALLAAYALGIGLPFIVAALAIGPFLGFMQRFRKHLGTMEKIMGALLVITGLLFVTGGFGEIGFWMLEMFPALGQVG